MKRGEYGIHLKLATYRKLTQINRKNKRKHELYIYLYQLEIPGKIKGKENREDEKYHSS